MKTELIKMFKLKKEIIRDIFLMFFMTLVLIFFSACGSTKKKDGKTEVTVFAAASLNDCLSEIKENYETEHNDIIISISFGSSGALMEQIEEGAPADVFFRLQLNRWIHLEVRI